MLKGFLDFNIIQHQLKIIFLARKLALSPAKQSSLVQATLIKRQLSFNSRVEDRARAPCYPSISDLLCMHQRSLKITNCSFNRTDISKYP